MILLIHELFGYFEIGLPIFAVVLNTQEALNRTPITRVPQAPSCPPRGWSAARVGIRMLMGAGDSLT